MIMRLQVDHCQVWQHSYIEIDLEIFSTVILSLPADSRRAVYNTGKLLRGLSLLRKSVVR